MRTARESTEYGPEQTHAPLLPAKPTCPRGRRGQQRTRQKAVSPLEHALIAIPKIPSTVKTMNTTEKNMAAAILRFEDDRVTGPNSLRITRLPAADKGGKWEICGICDGIEPAVFSRLKNLLDAGNREEAWEGCLQYVLDNTSAVRSWIGSGAHPATEFILRDHYFNSGSRNTGKILQRALNDHGASLTVDGIPGKQTRQTLQAVLARAGEAEFIASLNEQRKAFYRSCKQFPIFGKGWLNRSEAAYQFARSLV